MKDKREQLFAQIRSAIRSIKKCKEIDSLKNKPRIISKDLFFLNNGRRSKQEFFPWFG
jgi:vacuolar-type H+-ATPase subunit D/Vma8